MICRYEGTNKMPKMQSKLPVAKSLPHRSDKKENLWYCSTVEIVLLRSVCFHSWERLDKPWELLSFSLNSITGSLLMDNASRTSMTLLVLLVGSNGTTSTCRFRRRTSTGATASLLDTRQVEKTKVPSNDNGMARSTSCGGRSDRSAFGLVRGVILVVFFQKHFWKKRFG